MRGGFSLGVRLLLLSPLPPIPGSDYKGVVLIPQTLQPGTPGKPASHAGSPLVPLLALPTHPITTSWRWDKLPGYRITRTLAVTACVSVTIVVMVHVIGGSSIRECHLRLKRGSMGWVEVGVVCLSWF